MRYFGYLFYFTMVVQLQCCSWLAPDSIGALLVQGGAQFWISIVFICYLFYDEIIKVFYE